MNDRFWQWIRIRWWLLAGCALLLAFVLIHVTSLIHKGATTDEPVHYEYGYRVLHGAPQRTRSIDSSKMPFSSLNALTSESLAALARTVGISADMSISGKIKRGRYATIALSLLLALYVLKWSYELYGRNGALLSLSLYVFDPNLLAHGQLVTTDLPAALMMTMALYHFWHFLKLGGAGRALLSAATLGVSQLAKYTCIYLYPIFFVIAAIYRRSASPAEVATHRSWEYAMRGIGRWFVTISFFAIVNVLIINLGFKFHRVGTPLSGYVLKDPVFKNLQATPLLGSLPFPLPVPYVEGLDLGKFQERMGQTWGNLYMAGNLRVNRHNGTLHGFPGYYFYAAFFKVPIAMQVIFLLALFGFFLQRGQAASALRREEIFLLVPILVYWIYFNFFFNAQIGIRHILPVIALGTIFCGRFLLPPETKLRCYTALILVAWLVASTLSYHPHFISYFNEFVPDRRLAYRKLADSNLDWGGNEWYLAEYLRRHPGTIVDPRKPQAGRIVVPVNALVGINRDPEEYRWLREQFTPVDHIAYSLLVYEVPQEMLPKTSNQGR